MTESSPLLGIGYFDEEDEVWVNVTAYVCSGLLEIHGLKITGTMVRRKLTQLGVKTRLSEKGRLQAQIEDVNGVIELMLRQIHGKM